jgi:hypothetical protein
LIALVLLGASLLAGCSSGARVGALRTESHDLPVTIDSGAANITVRLPRDVGARVKVATGPHTIEAPGLTLDGDAYTNAAYGNSDVTMRVDVKAGIGQIYLEVGHE